MAKNMFRLTPREQFEQDLLDSGRSYGVELDPATARSLVEHTRAKLRELGYKPAREHALDTVLAEETSADERAAYKDFVDRRSQRWLAEARARRTRPFAPAEAYKDDTH